MVEPAWKRVGLKVTEESDPLAVTTHLDSAKKTKNETKKLVKQLKRPTPASEGPRKPPKRVKRPKSERVRPEPDQLAYLRQFKHDRENWKFSKQKQNWVLKHLEFIPQKYEEELVAYLEGLQGQSRDRVVEQLEEVVANWNKIAAETQKRIEAELNEENSDESKESAVDGNSKEEDASGKDEKAKGPTYDWAVRCRSLLAAMTGSSLDLIGVTNPRAMAEIPSGDDAVPKVDPDRVPAEGSQVEESPNKTVPTALKIDQVNVDVLATTEVDLTKAVAEKRTNDGATQKKQSKKKKNKKQA
ncbi:hypothetical protein DICA0_D21770 [Diutina catenulata]